MSSAGDNIFYGNELSELMRILIGLCFCSLVTIHYESLTMNYKYRAYSAAMGQ